MEGLQEQEFVTLKIPTRFSQMRQRRSFGQILNPLEREIGKPSLQDMEYRLQRMVHWRSLALHLLAHIVLCFLFTYDVKEKTDHLFLCYTIALCVSLSVVAMKRNVKFLFSPVRTQDNFTRIISSVQENADTLQNQISMLFLSQEKLDEMVKDLLHRAAKDQEGVGAKVTFTTAY